MTSRSIPARAALAAALAAALGSIGLLPGCLTRMLWAQDEVAPALIKTDTACQIHRVRGSFLTAPGADLPDPHDPRGAHDPAQTGTIEIEFSVRYDRHTPPEMRQYSAATPGRLLLQPRGTEPNWFALPGARLFRPRLWEFSVYRGSYFVKEQASVPMVFVGDLDPAEVGTLHASAAAPQSWQDLAGLPGGATGERLLDTGVAAFAQRDWIQLLEGKTGYTERHTAALAWLDGDGQVVAPEALAASLRAASSDPKRAAEIARYTLLGRLDGAWGETLYVRVPLPVVVQGRDLDLKRMGKRVFWRRAQVWDGTFTTSRPAPEAAAPPPVTGSDDIAVGEARPAEPAPSLAAHSVPLLTNEFVYSYAMENDGELLLTTLLKCVLTPPAILLDFAAQTSVFYVDILRWISGGHDQDWSGPIGPERRK